MPQKGQPAEPEHEQSNRGDPGNDDHSRTSLGKHERQKDDAEQKEPVEKDEQSNGDGHRDDKNPKGPPAYKRPAVIIPVSVVLALGIAAAIIYWLHARHYESTDDAYIDGHVVQVSPQVAAQVLALHVTDNQQVHKGDLLIELDPTAYQVAVEQAQAQAASAAGKLDQAQAQVGSAKASVTEAGAQAEAAQATLENATREVGRLEAVDERARSRQQLDNAIAVQRTNQAQLEQANAKKISAQASVATAEATVKAAEGDLKMAQSAVHRAEVNLSYCRIYSAAEGRVTQRTVEAGNYAQAGQTLFLLVEPDVWVTANFKETQLKLMQPGQPVTVKIDSVPGQKFSAHVDSIQAGSGSRFSVLPAENATGNFVKVVQRVPVKIVFDRPQAEGAWRLAPGLSVIPQVKVR